MKQGKRTDGTAWIGEGHERWRERSRSPFFLAARTRRKEGGRVEEKAKGAGSGRQWVDEWVRK